MNDKECRDYEARITELQDRVRKAEQEAVYRAGLGLPG